MKREPVTVATLTNSALAELLEPYLCEPLAASEGAMPGLATGKTLSDSERERLYVALSGYLDLLLHWNAHTNLTAVRSAKQIVTRHFGESLFAARCAASVGVAGEVLDFGSGAGFPGLPLQLYLPELRVALAESQGKKAAFLRQAAREINAAAEVWGARVEAMPSSRKFDLVLTRAVDDPEKARTEAWNRVRLGGWLLEMTTAAQQRSRGQVELLYAIPGTQDGVVALRRKRSE